jgi:hypothetical protein
VLGIGYKFIRSHKYKQWFAIPAIHWKNIYSLYRTVRVWLAGGEKRGETKNGRA